MYVTNPYLPHHGTYNSTIQTAADDVVPQEKRRCEGLRGERERAGKMGHISFQWL